MMELVKPKSTATEPSGLRGSGWIVAGFYLFAAIVFTSWAMGTGGQIAGPAPSASHHTTTGGAATSAATTGSAPVR